LLEVTSFFRLNKEVNTFRIQEAEMKASDLIKIITQERSSYLNFRFTDMYGKWYGVAYHTSAVDQKILEQGIMFDGSSIPSWRDINNSDMLLKPDLTSYCFDPFGEEGSHVLICDVYDPSTGKPYNRDPRSIAQKAEAYLEKTGLADTSYFGPEAEFFLFDEVRFGAEPNALYYSVEDQEMPNKPGQNELGTTTGHSIDLKKGYTAMLPQDATQHVREDMMKYLIEMGVEVEKHHHEVATCQSEIGIKYATLTSMADKMQKYKYTVLNTADMHGKSATFMPKPLMDDNGSGMHVHQSLWKNGTPLFPGNSYAGLSETALYYIGGILKHGRALNAFTNPTTNSYKRLVAGFEAPVYLAYSACNRSVACRIPSVPDENARRLETRFPDPTANAYLAFSAMLMAGLDGIKNKIHPGDALEENAYDLKEGSTVPRVAESLEAAVDALSKDRAFLTEGGVFDDDMLDAYIDYKKQEAESIRDTVHPIEYKYYYSS